MILKNGKKEIFVYEWPVESPKAIVQIVHGMAEHAGRYDAFARSLNGHGYYVVADDHRGHGKTDEKSLGYAPKDMFENTLLDEALVLETFQKKYADTPVIVLGFSYGSFLTQHFIARHGEQLAGAIVAGSSYKKDAEVYLGSVVAALGSFFLRRKKARKAHRKALLRRIRQGVRGRRVALDGRRKQQGLRERPLLRVHLLLPLLCRLLPRPSRALYGKVRGKAAQRSARPPHFGGGTIPWETGARA